MKRRSGRAGIRSGWLASLLLAGAWALSRVGAGTLPAGAVRIQDESGADRSEFRFTLDTPEPRLSAGPDGYARVEIEGFAVAERRPGAPDIPRTTLWVAIPPDAVPLLDARIVHEELLRGVRPVPVPLSSVTATPEGADEEIVPPLVRERFEEAPAFYADAEGTSREVARLGSVGRFRDQRYVEVHLSPVRYDPASRGLRIARSVEIAVRFEGTKESAGAAAPDERFEDIYRAAFVNYAQGTTFRVSAWPADRREPDERSSGAETLTTTPRYRIRVRADGVIRLDHALLAATPFVTERLSTYKLTNRGVEVPLDLRDVGGDDFIGPGDWVQFYGQASDDEPEAVLNADLGGAGDIFEARDFTDENVYFLTVESGARSRVATRASTSNGAVAPTAFEAVARFESDDTFRPLGSADPWYDGPSLSNPPANSLLSARTDLIDLPGLASGIDPVRVRAHLRGLSELDTVNPDHGSKVSLVNAFDQTLAESFDNGTFDGRNLYLHDFTWSYPGSGSVATGSVKVRLDALFVAGTTNQLILDWIELRYRRSFQASDDTLTFDWPDGNARFDVGALQTSAPSIYEITGTIAGTSIVHPVRITGASGSGAPGSAIATFRVDDDPLLGAGALRRFVVAGEQGIQLLQAGADFQPDAVSDLRSTSHRADLIVIAHPSLYSLAPGSALNQLLTRRAAEGIVSKVARIEDIQDEFGDGLPGPVAIRNFLRWVMSTAPGEGWAAPKPSFVLVLGDGSYDYKGGTATGNFVPTQLLFKDAAEWGYFGSDATMAAVVGDDLIPDLAIGRLPARSLLEADGLIQRIISYEQVTAWSSWRGNLLFIADRGKNCNQTEALDFEWLHNDAESRLPHPPYTTQKLYYWSGYCDGNLLPQPAYCPATDPLPYCTPADRVAITQDIKDAVNAPAGGAAIVQYAGHGNTVVWSDDAFWDERGISRPKDSLGLTNGTRMPWLLAHNCLTGGFLTPDPNTVGENWLQRGGGGAIAVFSPSGLGRNSVGAVAIAAIFDNVFGRTKERRIGLPVLAAEISLCQNGAYESCQHYVLLGDPSLRLTLPDVGPPTALQATAGNSTVALSWTASATPTVTYDLYRATSAGGAYAAIGSTTGTSFNDLTAQNATTYYYYAVARNALNFESRWSNFNGDCAVSGPDCVKATPLNPNPPGPPTGLSATDPERGGMLRVAWVANPESDIKGYELSVGVDPSNPGTPCPFDRTINVGKVTSFHVTGLADNVRHCLAVRATNTSLLTSSYSAEAEGTPTHVLGEKAPRLIVDLRLAKSGTNAVLTWGAVTSDIYGTAESVLRYEIFRGLTPDFVPAAPLATTTTPTFTDLGALADASPAYHYLVRAVDTAGNVGGLGNQLPAGIQSLVLAKGPSPQVSLSWLPVTEAFGGGPIQVQRYEIYGGAVPATRARIRDGSPQVPLLLTVTGTSANVSPPAGVQYYSVLAVDARGNRSPF